VGDAEFFAELKKKWTIEFVIERDPDAYFAYSPQLTGFMIRGDTKEWTLHELGGELSDYILSIIKHKGLLINWDKLSSLKEPETHG